MKHAVTTRAPESVTTSIHGDTIVAIGRGTRSVQLPDEELSPWRDLDVRIYPPELHHRVRSALCCGHRVLASYEGEQRGWTRRRALWLERREPAGNTLRLVTGITTFNKLYRVLLKHVVAAWLPDEVARRHYEGLGAALGEAGRLPPWPGGWPSWDHVIDGLARIDTPGLALLRRSNARQGTPQRLEGELARGLNRLKLNMFQRLRALEVLGRLAESWRYIMHETTRRAFGAEPTHIHAVGRQVNGWRQPGPVWIPLVPAGARDIAVTSITPTRWGDRSEDELATRFIRGRMANAVSRRVPGGAGESPATAVHQWLYRAET